MLRALVGLVCVAACSAGFGLYTNANEFTIDSGAGLVIQIRRRDAGKTTSIGDIASVKYKGKEIQLSNKGSHINSGFDWLYKDTSAVSAKAERVGSQTIKVTVTAGYLTHYYMVRKGRNHVYMGTYFTKEPTVHGHVRFICRFKASALPNGPKESDIRNHKGAVEAGDIFKMANGEIHSKHYSNMRLKDWKYIGATGSGIGAWIVRGNQEGGSGGPFYRSLLNQCTSQSQELTYIVNYGQAQTEKFRMGILNDYTLVFTNGGKPSTNLDTSWFSAMNLKGYSRSRGTIKGAGVNGRNKQLEYTVTFANDKAQYWADVQSNGAYAVSGVRAGTYTMTVYRGELAVLTKTGVKVNSGKTTSLGSVSTTATDPSSASYIWRIGEWDGRPNEFLNGKLIPKMHPSDPRMKNWDPKSYVVGESRPDAFPAVLWKGVNNEHLVYFKLTKEQYSQSHTLRIGITCAFAGGRPRVFINDWASKIPAATTQPKSRSFTTGSYRGNNKMLTYNVPASAFLKSTSKYQVLRIQTVSGSSGDKWLSPAFSFDCLDLLGSAGGSSPAAPSPKPQPAPAPKPQPAAPAPSGGKFKAGTYTIASKLTRKLVEVSGSSTSNGANVQQWTANGGNNQKWSFVSVGGGYYKIINVRSGKALDVDGGQRDKDGANVLQWDYKAGWNQQWAVLDVGSYFALINRHSEKGLDLAGRSTSDGANIQQYAYWGGNNQLWSLSATSGGNSPAPGPAPQPRPPAPAATPSACSSPAAPWGNCRYSKCCTGSGYKCYEANQWYAQCRPKCNMQNWSCVVLG